MKNRFRRWLRFGLAVAVLGSCVVMIGAPTANAVGCVGESCYNKGPVSMGCTADQRLISDPEWSPSLQILYSPACRAAWAVSDWTPNFHCIHLEIERARSDKIVQARLSQEFCPGEGKEWTNMFPGGWYFRAVWNDRVPGGVDSYTPWVFR